MTVQFQDGFDHYGDDFVEGSDAALNRALGFGWASFDGCDIGDPINLPDNAVNSTRPAAARTGRGAMRIEAQTGGAPGARLVLPTALTEFYVHFGLFVERLSSEDGAMRVLELRDNANAFQGELVVTSSGALRFTSAANVVLYTSANNTVAPGTWHSLQVKVVKSATAGALEVRLNDVVLVALTNQDTGATAVGMLRWRYSGADGPDRPFWIDDLVVTDGAGPYNAGFLGDVRVATLYPRADDEDGWTPNTRHKFGNGILRIPGSGGVSCADNPQLELGGGDYTLEGFFRFLAPPGAANRAVLFSKWREGTNERSFRFFLGGASVNNGHLQFEVSTDGTAGTVASIFSSEFTPVSDHWYHIAVQRASGVTVAFVDGVPIAAPVADANTYHDNEALFVVGAQQNTFSTMLSNSQPNGFVEEIRVTKGVARYNMSGFVPPSAAFGRSVGADPHFASVSLLMGFDASVVDESPFGRAVTTHSPAARDVPQDAPPGDYKTVSNALPLGDTGVEAPYTAAQSVLTFAGQPADNDTISLDGETYTFKLPFVDAANNVAVGASVNDSIDNLRAAINGDVGAGTLYGTGTSPSVNCSATNIDNGQMRLVANTPGAAGNAIVIGENSANASWQGDATTLSGGLDLPPPSSFFLTRLPPSTTGVRAVTLVARARKSDAGPARIRSSFVTADNSSANGAERSITTSDAYYADIVEQDPSTTSALSPASFIGARFRVDRVE